MIRKTRVSFFLTVTLVLPLFLRSAVHAQVSGTADVNMSRLANYQNECAIIKNPTNKLQLFSACNNATGGLFAVRSTDGGVTWTSPDADETIADGDANQGPLACCDPSLAWDTFGNLFITYLGNANTVETILSTDGGSTFVNLITFGPAVVDQPTIAVGAGEVWIAWNQSGSMVARGASVTGLGTANIGAFGAVQNIPGTNNCSFGDLAIAPGGAVVQACETPTGGQGPATIRVNIKADGLGPNPFDAGVVATNTNVGGFDFIPAQNTRSVDAEAGLAFDGNAMSPHFGRLYLVYTEEPVDESNDTDIMVRFSDDNGANWSNPPIRVNDDATNRSQFLPRIATNLLSGNIAVCWHDARNSMTNDAMQEFCSIATPTGATPVFFANAQIGDAASTGAGSNPPVAGQADIQFGDYSGLTYFQGVLHPAWADNSNSTGDNPNGTTRYDAYSDRVSGGAAAMEGDTHITTVGGVRYDFQGAGEFVSLRDSDGSEIQTRMTAIATSFNPGADSHDGLATCVSLNTAVAARVGSHRVTYQPNISGVPDPSGLQFRVDGDLTTLGPNGLDLGSGNRVVKTTALGGIEIDFSNGTVLTVTPGWWASQSKWYLNVDVPRTSALEGVMGAIVPGSWLPGLPDGSSMGPMPAALHQRYGDLYQKFANAWRVTDRTSLFDYAPGTSTASFTVKSWPLENPPCVFPENIPVKPVSVAVAEAACRDITNKNAHADCVFDVSVTGNLGFAKTYWLSQKLQIGSTTTIVAEDREYTQVGEPVTFTAVVERSTPSNKGYPTGSIQFAVDGAKVGGLIPLDSKGRASWETSLLKVGKHNVTATYIPKEGSVFLSSSSSETSHIIRSCLCEFKRGAP